MPYKYKRVCPICSRPEVSNISSHLEMVHQISAQERSKYLQVAVISTTQTQTQYVTVGKRQKLRPRHKFRKRASNRTTTLNTGDPNHRIVSEAYNDFRFRHKFSLMVVGPSMSGKSYFVKRMLERDHIEYEDLRKQRRIHWFYGQHQDMFSSMKRSLGKDIVFREGMPEFRQDLSELDPRYNNIVVLDDLMDLAVDSPIISKLFTQGRHRNASVILLLQNAFPKGKFNTSISRNAQYMALFRCPADRRQIGIVADRIFDKNKPSFMTIYNDVTSKPYSYVLVDNKADTPSRRQIIVDVFGKCVSYALSDSNANECQSNAIRERKQTTDTEGNGKAGQLTCDDRQGPLVVRLHHKDWMKIRDSFKDAQSGGNLPTGWTVWRMYDVTMPGTYTPVQIKNLNSTETKYFKVCKDWLRTYYPQSRDYLT